MKQKDPPPRGPDGRLDLEAMVGELEQPTGGGGVKQRGGRANSILAMNSDIDSLLSSLDVKRGDMAAKRKRRGGGGGGGGGGGALAAAAIPEEGEWDGVGLERAGGVSGGGVSGDGDGEPAPDLDAMFTEILGDLNEMTSAEPEAAERQRAAVEDAISRARRATVDVEDEDLAMQVGDGVSGGGGGGVGGV